jgi:phosphatidate phosphatase APP1
MIEPHGISVISDIDDTIKITDILDGKDAILQNTFFRTTREVPHMSEVYRSWAAEGAHFHYVSNSPWQVYPALSEFLITREFPKGSMHLRAVSPQQLIRGKPGKHKIEVINRILQDFPDRKFILVGDSGEIDPEM